MGMFPGFLLMLLLWAFNGIVQSLIWPQLIQIFSSWFCGAAQMRACVYINTTVPLGTFAAYGFASWGVQNDVWVSCFFLPGWILCAFSVVWLTTMRFWERTTERTEIAVQSMQTQKISRPLFSGVTNSGAPSLLCYDGSGNAKGWFDQLDSGLLGRIIRHLFRFRHFDFDLDPSI